MFSEHLKEYAEERYQARKEYLRPVQEEIDRGLAGCSPGEETLMKFLYGTMPLRDAGEYGFSVFYSYVLHAVWLREHVDWCRELPEDIFVHYVAYYRINTEDITDCRGFFYGLLRDRIKGMDAKSAVLEINYWCAENAAYEASDNRTVSPVTVYRSGKGRCGEESTFAVTAFRSVGLPARQVYTPRWAHCDDNHAWVEVYLEGKWYFLGACEPEEVLNKGWFTNASSRAVLVHSRVFSDYVSDPAQPGEECIGRDGLPLYLNHTSAYARTRLYTIEVKDSIGRAVEGAEVSIELLNMAEYCSIAVLHTDHLGQARITLGLGDVHIRAVKDTMCAETWASVRASERTELVLGSRFYEDRITETWELFNVEAPEDYPMHPVTLSREQKQRRRERLALADRLRGKRLEDCYREAAGACYPEEAEILRLAGGNFEEVYTFLSRDENPDRRAMLHSLSVKDYKDLKAEILESHLNAPRGNWDEDTFRRYILCPRIYHEEITPYREYIETFFSEAEKRRFLAEPEWIWDTIWEMIAYVPELDYRSVCSTPVGCLKLKQGSVLSRRILFVAVCRTLGIPARLNKVTGEPEYHDGEGFVVPGTGGGSRAEAGIGPKARLTLSVEDGGRWNYYQTWTVGRLTGSRFVTLDYEGVWFDGNSLALELESGVYRVICTSRMPNGSQHASERVLKLAEGEERTLSMTLREGGLKDMLVRHELVDFEVTGRDGAARSLSDLVGGEDAVLVFTEEGAEPTEHVLNELMQTAEEWNRLGRKLFLIARDETALLNRTLVRAAERLKTVQIYFDPEGENAETAARRMYVDPEKLPLLVVLKKGLTGIYGCSGYHVGSVALMLKILKG